MTDVSSRSQNIVGNSQNNLEIEQRKDGELKFSDLAPIDNLNKDNGYLRALDYAFKNNKIRNIAVSGPFGSGKSSIIKSYEKSRACSFVNISLATFGDERDKETDSGQIEKSILQQLLYGVDAALLPYSRFSRIVPPKLSVWKAIFVVIWLICAFYAFNQRDDIFNSNFFTQFGFREAVPQLSSLFSVPNLRVLKLLPLITFIFGAVYVVYKFYHKYGNFSLKKLSASGVEVERMPDDNESFLSLHLDEIIYFFQTIESKVVVFEDLDRFDKPEIFHNLREINKLVNDGCDCKVPIKFIYAIKDDMFLQNDRTKFFDFIIPVMPIVNTSNSQDKFRELLISCNLLDQVEGQLLRDVSYYLNDLRLVINIVNEFEVYIDQLPEQGLDKTKLLAMMVYKNYYVRDFEQLHQQDGVFFKICEARSEFEQQLIHSQEQQILEIRKRIDSSQEEVVENVADLIRIFLAQIIYHSPKSPDAPLYGFLLNGKEVNFPEFYALEKFESLVAQDKISLLHRDKFGNEETTTISFQSIEKELDPDRTFIERKEDIERRSAENRAALETKVSQLKQEIFETRNLPLKDLIEKSSQLFEDIISKNSDGKSDFMLMQNLFYNGYVDENYNDLISHFHKGRLGQNDLAFLKTIRSHKTPSLTLKLENPDEVCEDMTENDFAQRYILNISLMEYLLENEEIDQSHLEDAVHFIAANFDQADEFLDIFYTAGKNPGKLVQMLSYKWDQISKAARASSNSIEHISQIISHVDAEFIIAQMNDQNELTKFVEKFGAAVENKLSENESRFILYKSLGVCFEDLSSLKGHNKLLLFVISNNMFKISIDNINFIFSVSSSKTKSRSAKIKTSNYTCILKYWNEHLQNYIDDNIINYVEDVLLAIEENKNESGETIIKLLSDDRLTYALKEKIIIKQDHVFDNFDEIPQQYMLLLLVNKKVLLNWQNLSSFQSSDSFDEEIMTGLFNQEDVLNELRKEKISVEELGEEASKSLSYFIINNDQISDTNYGRILLCLPYTYGNFPKDISADKQFLLINMKTVSLTDKTHAFCEKNNKFMSALIEKNEEAYFSKMDEYPINDEVRETLLSSSIEDGSKAKILETISPAYVIDRPVLAKQIASLLFENNFDLSKVDEGIIEVAIVNAEEPPISIKILLSMFDRWDAKTINRVVSTLPPPYAEIGIKGEMPKLEETPLNLEFASALEKIGVISSHQPTKKGMKKKISEK